LAGFFSPKRASTRFYLEESQRFFSAVPFNACLICDWPRTQVIGASSRILIEWLYEAGGADAIAGLAGFV
jgi:hypothetical protein